MNNMSVGNCKECGGLCGEVCEYQFVKDPNLTKLDKIMKLMQQCNAMQQDHDYLMAGLRTSLQQKITDVEAKINKWLEGVTVKGDAHGVGHREPVLDPDAHKGGHKVPDQDLSPDPGLDQIGRLASVLEKGLLQTTGIPTTLVRLPQITLPVIITLPNSVVPATSFFGWKRKVMSLMKDNKSNGLTDSMVCNLIQNDKNIPSRFRDSVQNCSSTDSIFAIFATMCEPLESVYPQLLQNLTSLPACHDTESQIEGLDQILLSITEIENFFDEKDLTVTELSATLVALCTTEQLNSLPATISLFKDRHEREGIKYITILKEYSLKRRADLYNIKSAIQIYRPADY